MQAERIYKWDNAKFVAITGVVIGHMIINIMSQSEWPSFNALFFYIYTFHIPLFFFLSGLMQRPYQKDDRLNTGKLMMFFRGFLFINIFNWISLSLVGKDREFQLFATDGAEWFFLAMIVFITITYFSRETSVYYLIVFSIVCACMAGYDETLHEPKILIQLIANLPYYLAGYALESEKVLKITEKKWAKLAGFVFLCALAFWVCSHPDLVKIYRFALTHGKSFNQIENGMQWYGELAVYLLSACSLLSVISLMPNKRIPFISVWGSRTLDVYLLHRGIAFMLVGSGLAKTLLLQTGRATFIVLWLILGFVLTCILSTKPFHVLSRIILGIEFTKRRRDRR